MSNEAYQEGIKARREGKARHENPYIGEWGVFHNLFKPREWWDIGWDAEDAHQRRSRSDSRSQS